MLKSVEEITKKFGDLMVDSNIPQVRAIDKFAKRRQYYSAQRIKKIKLYLKIWSPYDLA